MTSGDRAWVGLAVYVVVYDLYAVFSNNRTLSSAFWAAIDHPVRRWPTIMAWLYITGHLFRLIPAKYDPLRMFIEEVK